jgi:DNA-binding CsgD family transcriptional regulator
MIELHHFVLSFLVLTLLVSSTWTIVSLVLYLVSHKKLLVVEFSVGLSISIIVVGIALSIYAIIAKLQIENVSSAICTVGNILCVIILPIFIHQLYCLPLSKYHMTIFSIIDIVLIILLIFHTYSGNALYSNREQHSAVAIVLSSIFYGVFCYCFYIGIKFGKTVGDPSIRKISSLVFGVCLLLFPLEVAALFSGSPNWSVLFLSLMFLIVSSVCLFYSITFSYQPAYFKNRGLTEVFSQKFSITPREKEIIEALLNGYSNKELSEKLFISIKTVENHLTNIYQKTKVTNRIQLFNLIHINKVA